MRPLLIGNTVNPKTAKFILKTAISLTSAFIIGKTYQAGKKIEERVDAYYEEKTESETTQED